MENTVAPETIAKILTNLDTNLRLVKFKIRPGTEKTHFCSVMYIIDVTAKDEEGLIKSFTVMFKTMPQNLLWIELINKSKYFTKEISIYEKIFPEIMKPVEVNSFPTIFCTFMDGQKDFIAMENLTDKGYQVVQNRVEGLDENHSKIVLRKLAEFHAASFLKYQGNGDQLQLKYPEIQECFWKRTVNTNEIPEMNRLFIENTNRDIVNLLQKNCFDAEIIRRVIKALLDEGFETVSTLSRVNPQFPSVITHGDAWITNFLFKYDSDEIIDMKFVDFQQPRVSSRMIDIAYFIYTSVNVDILNGKLTELLNFYHDCFVTFCGKWGMDLPLQFNERELNWEYFLEEWEVYRKFGHFFGLLVIPVMYSDPNNPPDMSKMDEKDLKQVEGQPTNGSFDSMWDFKPMQKVLFNLILNHLPKN